MNSESDMEEFRQRIRAALAANNDKSQKELAKLLGISPAQVTSLLKAGGRRLQAAEVPIVEKYLGIRLFRSELDVYKVPPGAVVVASAIPHRTSTDHLTEEAVPIALDGVPPEIAPTLKNIVGEGHAEFWRLTVGDGVPGDFLVVDRSETPRSGDIVLAEVRQTAGRWIPIFRRYVPPWLYEVNSQIPGPPLKVGDSRIAIIGPVIASFRTRKWR
jgi:DNA-binding transcriptional regulator YdaS (Cro superfamily)